MSEPTHHPIAMELAHVDLDDARRDELLIETTLAMLESPGKSLAQALGGRSAAYRASVGLLTNDAVSPQAIIDGHQLPTLQRCRELRKVLATNDTTHANCKSSAGGKKKQLNVHTVMLFDESGVPQGVLDLQLWVRDEPNKAAQRKKQPVTKKESVKWLRALAALNLAAQSCPRTRFTLVSDAESDMYELFEQPRERNVELLSRACRDRALGDKGKKLFASMRELEPVAQYSLQIPARPAKGKQKAVPKRTAQMNVSFCRLQLDAPAWLCQQRRETLPSLTMSAVLVREHAPPPGQSAVEWLLLTTRVVRTLADAMELVQDYKQRWEIELYHKVLKSGLRIESSQLSRHDDLKRLIAICSIVAWRVMYILHKGRSDPDSSGEELLLAEEWQVLWLRMRPDEPLPEQAPNAGQLLEWIARLGGHLGRKHDKRPGVIVVWRGLASLAELAAGFRLAVEAAAKSKRSRTT